MDYVKVGMATLFVLLWVIVFITTGIESDWMSDNSKRAAQGAFICSLLMLVPVGYFGWKMYKENGSDSVAPVASTIMSALGTMGF